MRLAQLLFSQGFGTRRECAALALNQLVEIDGAVVDDPELELRSEGLHFKVRGESWPYHAKALLMLNKPAGYECSRQPRHHPGVLSLLPAPLRARGVQPVGRLDADTTGLLLLSDDGQLIHRLSSPKWHVPKVYQLTCAEDISDAQLAQLLSGVLLHDEPLPVRAAACQRVDARRLQLTLTEGKYHQVKRMLGALGNAVTALHRSRFGALALPDDLAEGEWRWIDSSAAIGAALRPK